MQYYCPQAFIQTADTLLNQLRVLAAPEAPATRLEGWDPSVESDWRIGELPEKPEDADTNEVIQLHNSLLLGFRLLRFLTLPTKTVSVDLRNFKSSLAKLALSKVGSFFSTRKNDNATFVDQVRLLKKRLNDINADDWMIDVLGPKSREAVKRYADFLTHFLSGQGIGLLERRDGKKSGKNIIAEIIGLQKRGALLGLYAAAFHGLKYPLSVTGKPSEVDFTCLPVDAPTLPVNDPKNPRRFDFERSGKHATVILFEALENGENVFYTGITFQEDAALNKVSAAELFWFASQVSMEHILEKTISSDADANTHQIDSEEEEEIWYDAEEEVWYDAEDRKVEFSEVVSSQTVDSDTSSNTKNRGTASLLGKFVHGLKAALHFIVTRLTAFSARLFGLEKHIAHDKSVEDNQNTAIEPIAPDNHNGSLLLSMAESLEEIEDEGDVFFDALDTVEPEEADEDTLSQASLSGSPVTLFNSRASSPSIELPKKNDFDSTPKVTG